MCDCVDNFDLVSGFLLSGYCREMLEGNTTQTFKGMSCPSYDYAVHFLDQKRQKKNPRWSNCHSSLRFQMVLEIASKLISAIAAAFADIRLFGSSAIYILNRLQPSLSPRSPRQTTPALVYQRLDCKGDPLKTSIKHALVPTASGVNGRQR